MLNLVVDPSPLPTTAAAATQSAPLLLQQSHPTTSSSSSSATRLHLSTRTRSPTTITVAVPAAVARRQRPSLATRDCHDDHTDSSTTHSNSTTTMPDRRTIARMSIDGALRTELLHARAHEQQDAADAIRAKELQMPSTTRTHTWHSPRSAASNNSSSKRTGSRIPPHYTREWATTTSDCSDVDALQLHADAFVSAATDALDALAVGATSFDAFDNSDDAMDAFTSSGPWPSMMRTWDERRSNDSSDELDDYEDDDDACVSSSYLDDAPEIAAFLGVTTTPSAPLCRKAASFAGERHPLEQTHVSFAHRRRATVACSSLPVPIPRKQLRRRRNSVTGSLLSPSRPPMHGNSSRVDASGRTIDDLYSRSQCEARLWDDNWHFKLSLEARESFEAANTRATAAKGAAGGSGKSDASNATAAWKAQSSASMASTVDSARDEEENDNDDNDDNDNDSNTSNCDAHDRDDCRDDSEHDVFDMDDL